jgi:tetratricopeptide (TPR) repeat protein
LIQKAKNILQLYNCSGESANQGDQTIVELELNNYIDKTGGSMTYEAALKARKNRKYMDAIRLYQATIELEPNNLAAHAGLALSLVYAKDHDHALVLANQVLEFDRNNDYAHLVLAIIHHVNGQTKKFVDELEKSFSLKPFVYDVAYTYACLLADERDIVGAIPILEKMIEADAAKQCRNYLYGLAYEQLRRPKLAIKHSLMAFRTEPSLKTLSLLVRVILGASPLLTCLLIFLFVASLAGLIWYASALPLYITLLFNLTYVLTWILLGIWVFAWLGLIRQKKKRSRILAVATVVNIGIFLSTLAYLLFMA